MTFSRRPDSMSRSMSGGPSRSGERNRSKSSPAATASTFVTPRAKHTAEFAADPRPWHRIPDSWQKCTMSWTMRKYPGKPRSPMTPSSLSMTAHARGASSRVP